METKENLIKMINEIKNRIKNTSALEKLLAETYELQPLYISLGRLVSKEDEK